MEIFFFFFRIQNSRIWLSHNYSDYYFFFFLVCIIFRWSGLEPSIVKKRLGGEPTFRVKLIHQLKFMFTFNFYISSSSCCCSSSSSSNNCCCCYLLLVDHATSINDKNTIIVIVVIFSNHGWETQSNTATNSKYIRFLHRVVIFGFEPYMT